MGFSFSVGDDVGVESEGVGHETVNSQEGSELVSPTFLGGVEVEGGGVGDEGEVSLSGDILQWETVSHWRIGGGV